MRIMAQIRTYEDLARALKRFEELFGAREGSPEASELRDISDRLRSFEDQVAARIAAQKMTAGSVLDHIPSTCPPPANLP